MGGDKGVFLDAFVLSVLTSLCGLSAAGWRRPGGRRAEPPDTSQQLPDLCILISGASNCCVREQERIIEFGGTW